MTSFKLEKGPVLIVLGNEITRRLLSGLLRSLEILVEEASGESDAFRSFAHQPAALLLDGDEDEKQLASLIMSWRSAHAAVPVMLMRQSPQSPLPDVLAKLEDIHLLSKPVEPKDVEALLAGAKPPPPAPLIDMPTLLVVDGKDPRINYMQRAIDLSQQMMVENRGGPFGAVIVRHGEIIAEGWNEVTSLNDPTAHAEVQAIRKATAALGDFSLSGCEIYTSCEPCPMCLSAIYWARLDRVYFANTREDAALIGFDDDFIYQEIPLAIHERRMPMTQLLHSEAQTVFNLWRHKKDKVAY